MLPFELFVFATPVSSQARRKQKRSDWREEIRAEALKLQVTGDVPATESIRVRIGYYFRNRSLDLDNILKAILELDVSAAFARALLAGADFVHITVDRPTVIEVLR